MVSEGMDALTRTTRKFSRLQNG